MHEEFNDRACCSAEKCFFLKWYNTFSLVKSVSIIV